MQRLAPKLVGALDRAIELCSKTLKFGKAQEAPPERRRFKLALLVGEVGEMLEIEGGSAVRCVNLVEPDLEIDADRDQLFRILFNLVRNGVQAVERAVAKGALAQGEVRISAHRDGTVVTLQVADDGPGMPSSMRPHLFEAFRSAGRPDGVGLGLAIAAELTQLHGGTIELLESESGTSFALTIPDTVARIGAQSQASG